MLDFQTYQKQAVVTDTFQGKSDSLNSNAFLAELLGLVGEAGEVAEKFKKIYRDKQGVMSEEDNTEMKKELGDILWYVSIVCTHLGYSLKDVAQNNLDKLKSRLERQQIGGSGDNR